MDHPPTQTSSTEASHDAEEVARPRQRSLLGMWIAVFAILGLLGAFCALLVRPYLEAREAVRQWASSTSGDVARQIVDDLGGRSAAASKLGFYIRLPERLAPEKGTAGDLIFWHCGTEAVPYLIGLVKTEGTKGRDSAVRRLGDLRDARAVEPLVAVLSDGDPHLRSMVAWSLGLIGDPRAVPALKALAENDPEIYVRIQARDALEKIRASGG